MKKLVAILSLLMCASAFAQRNKTPKMLPTYSPGYYVNSKADTVRGEIRNNPEDETSIFRNFSFKAKGASKARTFDSQRIKAYGFDDRHFVQTTSDQKKLFIERISVGRLNFYEFQYLGKVDGYKGIVSDYYINDSRAEGDDAHLQAIKQISTKYYKKSLKPYMKDQPMIWSDLDKYNFNRNVLVQSIDEFNRYYATTAN